MTRENGPRPVPAIPTPIRIKAKGTTAADEIDARLRAIRICGALVDMGDIDPRVGCHLSVGLANRAALHLAGVR